jgi:hypothetical protein
LEVWDEGEGERMNDEKKKEADALAKIQTLESSLKNLT